MCSERSWAAGVLALALLTSCGDPLVGGDYPGEPLLELAGEVVVTGVGELDGAEGSLRLAVFWAAPEVFEPGAGQTDFADQNVSLSDLPGSYYARIYAPPGPASMFEVEGVSVAIGSLVIYVDVENDGHFDAGVDAPVGSTRDNLLLYTDGAVPVPGVGKLPRGYHPLRVERAPDTGQSLCGEPLAGIVNYELEDEPIPVVIGLLHQMLVDVDCDQRGAEYDVCPPPPHIVDICDGDWEQNTRCFPWAHCD